MDPPFDLVPVRGDESGEFLLVVLSRQTDQPADSDDKADQADCAEDDLPHTVLDRTAAAGGLHARSSRSDCSGIDRSAI